MTCPKHIIIDPRDEIDEIDALSEAIRCLNDAAWMLARVALGRCSTTRYAAVEAEALPMARKALALMADVQQTRDAVRRYPPTGTTTTG